MSKAAKLRACPAVQRDISPAECGENRGSRYACPADCLYSPLASANYSLLLELEDEVDRKSLERLKADESSSPAFRKAMQQALNSPSPHAGHAFFSRALFFQRDANGLTWAERWRRQGFPGLNNDERVLFQAKMRTRVALLEIHRIIDDERLAAVDLLEANPRPMLLRDRNLASVASRFSTPLVWLYSLPHYGHMSGTAIRVMDISQLEPEEIVREIARHLGGPATEMELRAWLAENFVRFDESLAATLRMRSLQMFAGIDSQWGKAVYELRAPFAACRDALDEIAAVEPDSLGSAERDEGFAESRVWMGEEDMAKVAGVPFVLGRVLLGQSHCRLESIGRERLGRLRQQFEKALGERTRFVSERFDDLPSTSAEKEPPPNMALIPPKLLQEPSKIMIGSSRLEMPRAAVTPAEVEAEARARHYRSFLENPVPALDGLTPRQAAQDPARRPKLIRLLKQWVREHDEENLRTGRNDDINWLLRELGLVEIIFDPPPPRAIPPSYDAPGEDAEEDIEAFIDDNDFPRPVLPPKPLSEDEVLARLDALHEEFATAEDALEYLEACDSNFMDDAASLCEEVLNPEEFNLFAPCLMEARLALVPSGFREPALDFDRLLDNFGKTLDKFSKAKQDPDTRQIRELLNKSRQPCLVEGLVLTLLQAIEETPQERRPSPPAQLVMILTLKHMIDELDRSIRE